MGYYTSYTIESSDDGMVECPTCGTCGALTHELGIEEQIGYDPFGEANKWYHHEEDMRAYSKKFPDVVFTINGEGEESGDVWVKYFKNGKMQKEVAEIQLAPFDEGKLE